MPLRLHALGDLEQYCRGRLDQQRRCLRPHHPGPGVYACVGWILSNGRIVRGVVGWGVVGWGVVWCGVVCLRDGHPRGVCVCCDGRFSCCDVTFERSTHTPKQTKKQTTLPTPACYAPLLEPVTASPPRSPFRGPSRALTSSRSRSPTPPLPTTMPRGSDHPARRHLGRRGHRLCAAQDRRRSEVQLARRDAGYKPALCGSRPNPVR